MRKPIHWMASNSVAANLAMLVCVVGGLIFISAIKQEIFPEIQLEMVNIAVPYPGAGPDEVEQGVVLPIEEAISAVDGIEEITSLAYEGAGVVTAEIIEGENTDQVLQDIKAEVDRLQTLPREAEEPTISKVVARKEVLSVIVSGNLSERALREYAEQIREDLVTFPNITNVELAGVRPYEISIDVSEVELRRYGLTLEDIARRIRQASIDLPAGVLKARGGEILLRTKERREIGEEYAQIRILSLRDGTEVLLSDVADVRDDFEDTDVRGEFDGKPAAMVNVFRVGNQTPLDISTTVKEYVELKRGQLPDGVLLNIWNDRSKFLRSRMDLLLKNAAIGLLLVFVILGLFLELKLAFWVTLGIPISFLGAMLFLPSLDVSINMIALFAFILCLGIVVDDAIIVGEAIYKERERGKKGVEAAVDGAYGVGVPVVFSVLTSVAAFLPMMFVTGVMGKFIWVIPAIVIPVLLLSLFECLFILPAHLAHSEPVRSQGSVFSGIELRRQRLSAKLSHFIDTTYKSWVTKACERKYLTLSIGIGFLIIMSGMVGGGYLKFVNMPTVDGEMVKASIEMPIGTPIEETEKVARRVHSALSAAVDKIGGDRQEVLDSSYVLFGSQLKLSGHGGGRTSSGGNIATVVAILVTSEGRSFSSNDFSDVWRESVGEIPGIKSLKFKSNIVGTNEDINIQLSHSNFSVLEQVSNKIKDELRSYAGILDVADNFSEGKREIKFKLKPEARTLGITEEMLARQLRASFYGVEAQRIQRERNELKVMVRYPESERLSLGDVESMRVRTPDGGEVPFGHVASIDDSKGFSTIRRSDRRRVVNITASVNYSIANPKEVIGQFEQGLFPQLVQDFPGLIFSLEGQEQDRRESNKSLFRGFLFAMLIIYALLAIPFKSYIQPVIVMAAIPFGFIGAGFGHLILGHSISMLSMCGLVALAGVVVNDSLVLVDYINNARRNGSDSMTAVVDGGCKRFRQIVLTSVTTFFGLTPIIFETSVQAQFLIPMAISLGFGILFTTGVALLLVPALYLIVEDARGFFLASKRVGVA